MPRITFESQSDELRREGPKTIDGMNGGGEATELGLHAALSPGEHVIVHWPCYQSHEAAARAIGAEVTRWVAREDEAWAVDPDELARLVQPRTKAIVLNTPHNPTGFLMGRSRFEAVCRLAERHDIALLSDEVYRDSEYDPAHRLPAACEVSSTAASLGGTAKTLGARGTAHRMARDQGPRAS